jgi:site-specific recombinase XerD
MVEEIPEHQLREVKVKLPKDLVEWLEKVARARGETIDGVLTWTLGILHNFYDRWFYTVQSVERVGEITNSLEIKLEKFKEYLADQGIKTLDNYYVARKFVEWLKNKDIDSLDNITHETIELYLRELKLRTSTQRLYRHYLKKFLSFIKSE